MRTPRLAATATAAAAALLLGACTLPAADDTADTQAPADASSPSTSGPDADDDAAADDGAATDDGTAPDTGAPDAPPPAAPVDCTAETTAMLAVIETQLAAFADRDWEAALGLTSDSFRSTVDAADLERIILDGYPEVADGGVTQLEGCTQVDDDAQLLVTVDGPGATPDAELVYLMRREADEWRIDGAVRHGGGVPDDTTTV